jgi:hypothetical protein
MFDASTSVLYVPLPQEAVNILLLEKLDIND